MKKLMFISPNRLLIEKVTELVGSRWDLDFCLFSVSRLDYVLRDIEIFVPEITLVDITGQMDRSEVITLCRQIVAQQSLSNRCLLLVKYDDESEQFAEQLKSQSLVEDYVLFENTLDSLTNKLLQFILLDSGTQGAD